MPRLTRYSLFFAAFATMILLTVSARRHGAGPLSSSLRPLKDWDIPELAVHLNRSGVDVRLWSVPKSGPLNTSAYLTCTAKQWRDLNLLNKDPSRIEEWHGTVYCEHVGDKDVSYLIEQWGEHCLIVGPFLFYGDAELLARVRATLREAAPDAA